MGHKGLALTPNLSLKERRTARKLSAVPNKTGDSTTSGFSDKQWNRGLEKLWSCKASIPEGFQDLAGQTPEELDRNTVLILFRTGGWTDYMTSHSPFQPKLLCDMLLYCLNWTETSSSAFLSWYHICRRTEVQDQVWQTACCKHEVTIQERVMEARSRYMQGIGGHRSLLSWYRDDKNQKIKNHQALQRVAQRSCSIPVLEGLRPDWIKPWAAQADLGDGPALSRRLDCRPSEVPSNQKHPKVLWKTSRVVRVLEYKSLQDEVLQNAQLAGRMHSHALFFFLNFYYCLSCLCTCERLVKSPDSLLQCQHTQEWAATAAQCYLPCTSWLCLPSRSS